MVTTFDMTCVVCHKPFGIGTTNVKLYDLPVVRENAICPKCDIRIKNKVKLVLTCVKCKHVFQTKVLDINKDKYAKDWLCPMCLSNEMPKSESKNGKSIELNCGGCQIERGVCKYPQLGCTHSKHFVPFGNGNLYSLNKDCTILSVHSLNKDRDDIHCLNYTLLSKAECSIAPNNSIIIKQRMGSRKNFVTNVIVYRFNSTDNKFGIAFENKFEKGKDWIIEVKKFLLEK